MTDPRPIRTVGDLVEHLQDFDQYLPIRAQQAAATDTEFIVAVTPTPDEPETVSIIYMPQPKK